MESSEISSDGMREEPHPSDLLSSETVKSEQMQFESPQLFFLSDDWEGWWVDIGCLFS